MIPLATIQIGEDRNTYDINAVFTDASTVLGSWEPIAGQVQVRCHLSTSEAVAFVCAAIAAYAPANNLAEPTPPTEQPTIPLGCVSRSADLDSYLTGDVVAKLAVAQAAGPRYSPQAVALADVQPHPIPHTDISVGLGAEWVPAEYYKAWLYHLFAGLDWGLSVERSPSGVWLVVSTNPAIATLDNHVRTSRVDALDLISAAMNNQMPLVTDTPSTPGRPIRNEAATMEAQARVQELRQKFDSWVWTDEQRTAHLVEIYNARFNRFVSRSTRSPRPLTTQIAHVVSGYAYKIKPHQLRGVTRIIEGGTYDRSAYLVYPPGYGKTDPAVIATEELRAAGQGGRTVIAVPASVVGQWLMRYRKLYPKASHLLAYSGRTAAERREFWRTAQTAQVLIISHEMLREVPLSLPAYAALVSEELTELRQTLRDAEYGATAAAKESTKLARRALRARDTALRGELEAHALYCEGRPTWESLSVDHLIIDEAHFAKSLGVVTRMERVSGLPRGESARALDCWAKCQTVLRSGGRVTALSGTPLTNSLAEAHIWMRMLQPGLLARVGLSRFDDWASVFAEAHPSVEMDCVGRFRAQTRLRFRNVPELLGLLGECWDFAGSVEMGLDSGNETVRIGI